MKSARQTVRHRLTQTATLLIVAVAIAASPSYGVEPILNLEIEQVAFSPNDSVVEFDVMMNSVEDSVAGFEIMLLMSDPSLLRFHESDPLDITGSVITDWGFLDWTDIGTSGAVIKVVGIWDFRGKDRRPLPIPPADEPQLLFTLRTQIVDPMPDTLCNYEGVVIIADYETRFSTPCEGSMTYLIGYDTWIEYDSTFENCVEWEGDSCVAWADTIVEEIPHTAPNFELLNYQDGQYRILCYQCGDADGSGLVDIDDPVFLIAYIFGGGPAPDPLEQGDADYSGAPDIDDVVYLIAYIFSAGPAPCAVF